MLLSEKSVRKVIKLMLSEITRAQVRLDTSASNMASESDPHAEGERPEGAEVLGISSCSGNLTAITNAEIPNILGTGLKKCRDVDFNLTNKTKKIIRKIFEKANEVGYTDMDNMYVTSGYRGPSRQARAMFNNWKNEGGPSGGREYLLGLYAKGKEKGHRNSELIGKIDDSFTNTNDYKEVANILGTNSNITKITNHWNGNTFDIGGSALLTQSFRTDVLENFSDDIKIGDETATAGPHWHIYVKNTGWGDQWSGAKPGADTLPEEEGRKFGSQKFLDDCNCVSYWGNIGAPSNWLRHMIVDEFDNVHSFKAEASDPPGPSLGGGPLIPGFKPNYSKYTFRTACVGGRVLVDGDGRNRVILAASDDGGATWNGWGPIFRRVYNDRTDPKWRQNPSGTVAVGGEFLWEVYPGQPGARSASDEEKRDLEVIKHLLTKRAQKGGWPSRGKASDDAITDKS